MLNNLISMIRLKGITVTKLAKGAGISRQAVYAILNGSDCKVSTFRKLCEIVGLKIYFKLH